MRPKVFRFLLLFACLSATVLAVLAQDAPPDRIDHNGQDLFLSGINLAWINFGRDTSNFDEPRFVAALDAIAKAKGNTLRWWLHTNGSASPIYDGDGKVIGLGPNDIKSMQRALDLAYERGILIMMTLWSHDMMNDQNGVPTDANKLMIEDPEYTQAYIDNALIPLVMALKGHPGIVAWEVFNEPEGTTDKYGWTDQRTTMESIQQFVNLIAGAIHRADPNALVTNGSWNFRVMTDVGGMTNYYTDERLIEAGGDEDGTLDFYTVHYYPEWFDESTSPFHNPASHWELDKAIVVAEFPAIGLIDLGTGYMPRTELPDSIQTYSYLFENGYAGAVAWAYTGGQQFGGLPDAEAGMLNIANELDAEAVTVDIGELDRIPVVLKQIANVVVPNDTTALPNAVTLSDIFSDVEDGADLDYVITNNSKPDIVEAVIEEGVISLNFTGKIGSASVEVSATDAGDHTASAKFVVQVVDPNVGNMALGKQIVASTIESEGFAPGNAVDGLLDTRSSTEYTDPQWYIVDLGGIFTIKQVVLHWEAAFGNNYDIQMWDGSEWQTVYHEPLGDGEIDDLTLETPVDTRFVKFNGMGRGAEWGYSLWEFEVNGIRSETANAALETVPPEFTAALEATPEAPTVTLDTTTLYSFEESNEGWAVVDFWTAITSAELSTEMASDGSSSLAATGSFSGTEWQEGGVFLSLPDGADWSAYDVLTIDVYAPEEASGFIAQIYTKTGADSAWTNTADMPLTAGEWNTLTADLSTLGDLTAVNEVGLKIGTSITAFEGTFFIDNVAAAALPQEPEETATDLELTPLYDFEEGAQGWAVVDFWTGITSAELSTEMANEGTSSLAAAGTFNGTEWQEGGVFITLPEGTDWSTYDALLIDVYVPAEASNFIAQVYTKTGADSAWMNTADTPLTPGEWNTITADLHGLGELAAVHEVGLKIGTSSTAFTGTFFIDSIVLAKKVVPAAPEEVEVIDPSTLTAAPLSTFESDSESWAIADFWTGITSAEASTEMANEGTGSLAATGTFSGTEWQEGGVFLALPEGTDWSSSKLLTLDVYVPEGASNFIAQIYAKTGPEWTWANTADFPLSAGQWNTLTADLSTLGNPAMMHEVGLKIGTSSTAFIGTFFVDNVQLLGE